MEESGIWLSTTKGRSWCLAPGSPTGVGEGITTYKPPDGTIYAGFALGGIFYSHDNGYQWANTIKDPLRRPGSRTERQLAFLRES